MKNDYEITNNTSYIIINSFGFKNKITENSVNLFYVISIYLILIWILFKSMNIVNEINQYRIRGVT